MAKNYTKTKGNWKKIWKIFLCWDLYEEQFLATLWTMKGEEVQVSARFRCVNHRKGICFRRGKKRGGVAREAARSRDRKILKASHGRMKGGTYETGKSYCMKQRLRLKNRRELTSQLNDLWLQLVKNEILRNTKWYKIAKKLICTVSKLPFPIS